MDMVTLPLKQNCKIKSNLPDSSKRNICGHATYTKKIAKSKLKIRKTYHCNVNLDIIRQYTTFYDLLVITFY